MIAATALCLVVAIADGDTLTARCGEPGQYQQVKVRLAEIDAPERKQPFGNVSRQHLAKLCFKAWARLTPLKTDRYRRTVARVECEGVDASAHLVRAGLAWAYTEYLTDPQIKRLEESARAARAGLWKDEAPVAPWAWRKRAHVDRASRAVLP